MKLKSSDVFEEYARIAMEQGLISTAAEEDSKDDSKKESEKSKKEPKELSSAEIFYGIKNKPISELLEEAHPKTVVMGPSYDKFNGVVENLSQRSDMMQHIALKNPAILQTNHRYIKAHQDLLNETVKLGFYLDNSNNEKLMKLADYCTAFLNKTIENQEFFKSANPFFAAGALGMLTKWVAILAGAALVTGTVASNMYTSQGIKNDITNFTERLNKLKSKYPEISKFFHGYNEKLQELKAKIIKLEKIGKDLKLKQLEVLKNTNKKVQERKFKELSKLIKANRIDEKIKSDSDQLVELLDNIIDHKSILIPTLQEAKSEYSIPETTFEQWMTRVKEQVVQSKEDDVVDIMNTITEQAENYKQVIETNLMNIEELAGKASEYSDEYQEEYSDEYEEDAEDYEDSLTQKVQESRRRPSKMYQEDEDEDYEAVENFQRSFIDGAASKARDKARGLTPERSYYRDPLVEAFSKV
jgi:hypothetical protein